MPVLKAVERRYRVNRMFVERQWFAGDGIPANKPNAGVFNDATVIESFGEVLVVERVEDRGRNSKLREKRREGGVTPADVDDGVRVADPRCLLGEPACLRTPLHRIWHRVAVASDDFQSQGL